MQLRGGFAVSGELWLGWSLHSPWCCLWNLVKWNIFFSEGGYSVCGKLPCTPSAGCLRAAHGGGSLRMPALGMLSARRWLQEHVTHALPLGADVMLTEASCWSLRFICVWVSKLGPNITWNEWLSSFPFPFPFTNLWLKKWQILKCEIEGVIWLWLHLIFDKLMRNDDEWGMKQFSTNVSK